MSRWLSGLPTEQVVYFAACELIYRRLLATASSLEPLGKHFDVLAGYAFKSGDYDSSGVRLLRNINVKPDRIDWADEVCLPLDEAKAYQRFQLVEGDLVLSMDGTVNKQGIKLAFLGKEDVPSLLLQRVCRLAATGKMTTRYLYHMLHSVDFLDHLDKSNRSIAIPHVSPTQLQSFPIPVPDSDLQGPVSAFLDAVKLGANGSELPQLPFPLAEQRRVVARIAELAGHVQEAHRLRQQAMEAAQAVIVSARRSVFGDAPQPNWIPMGGLIAKIENGKSPQCEPRPAVSDEWGVLKVGAISFGVFDDKENKALPNGLRFDPSYEVRSGDFLMSRANTTQLVGTCAIVNLTRPRLLLSDKTFRFHFNSGVAVVPRWLDHALKSPALRSQIEREASGTSPTMKNISKEKVMGLLLPPHSPPEQHRVVTKLDALQAQVDAVTQLQAETAVELDALLPAILDRAFKGELR